MKRRWCLLLLALLLPAFMPACSAAGPPGKAESRQIKESSETSAFPTADFKKESDETTEAIREAAEKAQETKLRLRSDEPFNEALLEDYLYEEFNRPSILREGISEILPVYYEIYTSPESAREVLAAEHEELLSAFLEEEGWPEGTLVLYVVLDVRDSEAMLLQEQGYAHDGTADLFIKLLPQESGYRLLRTKILN